MSLHKVEKVSTGLYRVTTKRTAQALDGSDVEIIYQVFELTEQQVLDEIASHEGRKAEAEAKAAKSNEILGEIQKVK